MNDNQEVIIDILIKGGRRLRILGHAKGVAMIFKNLAEEDK